MDYEPLSVALKFGFIAILYLFLLWIARSALKDLRGTTIPTSNATGMHAQPRFDEGPAVGTDAWLVVERGGGLRPGDRLDMFGGLSIGRSADADVRIEDRYASGIHARVFESSGRHYVEDMQSTNGTLLNDSPLNGEAELINGDLIRIGDTEFRFDLG